MTTLYVNALLVNGMLVNWKIGNTCWDTVETALCNRQPLKILLDNPDKVTVAHEAITVSSVEERSKVFQDTQFFKQFKIHPAVQDIILLP